VLPLKINDNRMFKKDDKKSSSIYNSQTKIYRSKKTPA